jgi:hypothetical protein
MITLKMKEVKILMQILESKENWTIDLDSELMKRCTQIIDAILKKPSQACLVPFEKWLVIMAAMPTQTSIILLARLDSVIGGMVNLLVRPQKEPLLREARTIMIQRSNILIRHRLQETIFTANKDSIQQIVNYLED